MTPETWLPTATVVTADSVPVAVTVMVIGPRSTFSVRYCKSFPPVPRQESKGIRSRAMAERRNFKKNTFQYDHDSATVEGAEV
jgi:hypothetical protein